jgi:hypothetical protein
MSQREHFVSKFCVPFRPAIHSSFCFQTLLAGLLLCAMYAHAPALASEDDRKAQSGRKTPQQLAVLHEEDPADPAGKRYAGSVVWRTETIQHPGETPDIAVLADIEIPERNLKVAISFGRNRDPYLSANHKIEINFAVPPKFGEESVGYVQSVRMRPGEKARYVTLASPSLEGAPKNAAKPISQGFVVFGLSDLAYNQLQLIEERSWFDMLLFHNNGRWAILTIESGASGREIFEKAFTAWKAQ